MVRHIFFITTQELPDTGQPETQIALRLMGLDRAFDGFRLELPLGPSRIHALNDGWKEGGVVVVDQGYSMVDGSPVQVGTLSSCLDLTLDHFVGFVLRNQVLKLEPK